MAVDVDDLRRRWTEGEAVPAGALRRAKLKGADLTGLPLAGQDLSGADLRGATLTDVDLKGANLQGARLQGANLAGADLRDADLTRARVGDADLQGAQLQGAKLPRVNLSEARLRGAQLDGADLRDVDLSQADLADLSLAGADLHRATLDGARLKDVNLRGAKLGESFLERVTFKGCDLTGADLERASLARSTLIGCDLTGARAPRGDFGDARLSTCILREADLTEAIFDRAQLDGVDLDGAQVEGADFQGAGGLDDGTLEALESRGAVVHGLRLAPLLGDLVSRPLVRRGSLGALALLLVFFFYYYMTPEQQPVDAVLDRAAELRQGGESESALALYDALIIRLDEGDARASQLSFLRAEALVELGRHEEAAAIFSEMAERPDQGVDEAVDARLRLAAVKADEGAFDAAIPILEAVAGSADTAPRDVTRALISLSSLYERMGFPDRALEVARGALDPEGGRPEVTLAVNRHIANLLVHAGRFEDAEGLLRELEAYVHDDSARAELLISQARLYQKMGQEDRAIEAMGRLLKDYPENPELSPEVRMELAQLFGERGELEAAERILRDLMEDTNAAALANQAALSLANLLSDNGQHTRGLEVLESLEAEHPLPPEDVGQLALTRAYLLSRTGQGEAALEILIPATTDPSLGQVGPALLAKAQLLQDLGRHAEAEATLQQVLDRFGGVADMSNAARMGLGRSLSALGRHTEAAELYQGMLNDTTDPDIRANLTQLLGQSRLALGDSQGATAAFSGLTTGEGSAEAQASGYFGLAEIAREAGRTQEAVAALRKVVEITADPTLKAIALENLARTYKEAGEASEASLAYAEILDLLPPGHEQAFAARMGIAQIYAEGRAFDQALKLYGVARAQTPSQDNRAQATMAEAELLSTLGRQEEAQALYRGLIKDLEARPDLVSEARLGLARGLEAAGALEDALGQYRRVAEESIAQSTALEGSRGWARILETQGRAEEAAAIRTRLMKETQVQGEAGQEAQLQAAEAQARAGALKEAVASYDAVLKEVTDDTLRLQALDGKARALMEAEALEEAAAAYVALVEAAAGNPDYRQNARMGLAGVYRAQGDLSLARRTYGQVAEESRDPGLKAWALESLAQLDLEGGDTAGAEVRYRAIIDDLGEDEGAAHGARMGLAQMRRAQGDIPEARRLLKTVEEESPDQGQRAWASLYIAQTYLDEEAHDRALEALLDVIQNHPEEREIVLSARLSLADLYRARGRLEEAARAYASAAEGQSFPEYRVTALLGAASTAQDLGQMAAAEAFYQAILTRFGALEEARFNARLGQARLQMREGQSGAQRASVTLEALATETEDPVLQVFALQALAQAHLTLGDKPGATSAYGRLLESPANLPEIKSEARDYLKEN